MTATLPMLSGEGWLKDPASMMNKLFIHCYMTDYSQSNIYNGYVTSLQYILAKHGDRVAELSNDIKQSLTDYYGRYFSQVTVDFSLSKQDDPDKSGKMIFDLHISGKYGDTYYDLNKTLAVDNSSGTLRFMEAFDAT